MKSKNVWLIAILGISILIIGPKLVGLEESLTVLKQANFLYVFLILLSMALIYISAAEINRKILAKIGAHLPFIDNLRLALIDVFAIHLLPVGSLGGATLEWLFLRKRNLANSQIVLLFFLRTIYIYLTFSVIFLLSALIIHPSSKLGVEEQAVLYTIVALAVIIFAYLIYVYRRENLYHKRFKRVVKIYNYCRKIFHKQPIELAQIEHSATDVYNNAHEFTRNWRDSTPLFSWSLLYWAGDILCLYFALRNFGYVINPAVLLFAYSVSSILAMATFVPGGVGVTEALLSLLLIGLGVPSAIAVISVIFYRLFTFWLLVPLGGWAFSSLSNGNGKKLFEK